MQNNANIGRVQDLEKFDSKKKNKNKKQLGSYV